MKIVLMSLVLISSLAIGKSFAQTVSATSEVYLQVKGTTSLTKVRDLSMGLVIQGFTSVNINPISGGSEAAYFFFVGEPNSPVTASFSSSDLTSGTYTIAFTGTLAGSGAPDQHNATLIASGDPVISNSDGEYYFWSGGTANLSPTQPYGIYTGSFTLSIAY